MISGESLKRFRKDVLRLTQRGLADKLGTAAGSIGHWEQGVNPVPPMAVLALKQLKAEAVLTRRGSGKDSEDRSNGNTSDGENNRSELDKQVPERTIFVAALDIFRAWRMENGPIEERTEVAIGKALGVSVDSLRRWRLGLATPLNVAKELELVSRMIISIELTRSSTRKQAEESMGRLETAQKILDYLSDDEGTFGKPPSELVEEAAKKAGVTLPERKGGEPADVRAMAKKLKEEQQKGNVGVDDDLRDALDLDGGGRIEGEGTTGEER